MKNRIVTPAEFDPVFDEDHVKVFLAGSIEMDNAKMWQEAAIKALPRFNIDIYNPRRESWDSSWEQSLNSEYFYNQVTWELDHLDAADIVYMYFDPNTKSPISLLELGLYAPSGKMIVCCPNEFWRKGNVDIVCQRYNIPVFTDFATSMCALKKRIEYTRSQYHTIN